MVLTHNSQTAGARTAGTVTIRERMISAAAAPIQAVECGGLAVAAVGRGSRKVTLLGVRRSIPTHSKIFTVGLVTTCLSGNVHHLSV
jgi:hypothetical protein